MDMTPYLHRQLTNTELMTRDGYRYEGQILRVAPQRVFNKFKFTKEDIVPVINFEDGWDWIPNLGARRIMTATWGADTDRWVGHRLRIFLQERARTEQGSGRAVNRLEKCVELLD